MNSVFNIEVADLRIGRNVIIINCFDRDGSLLDQKPLKLVRIATFEDVPLDHWAVDKINMLATLKIFKGYPDGTFMPGKRITRAELATLLVRALEFETPEISVEVFKDMSARHWASKYVRLAVDRNIVNGYRDGTFKPSRQITRTEGVLMISRFAGIRPVETLREKPFPDMPVYHWAAKAVQAARNEGLLVYFEGKPFEPNRPLTRAEAAEIIANTKIAKDREALLYQ